MSELLTAYDFTAFFRDVHGHEPFPWQVRLTEQVLRCGEWPKVIDLPTGAGKTAVLDTAVFALAARPDISPRRVVFVIDRRIVVDQVYERAQLIRDRIKLGSTATLRLIQERLHALSGGELLGVAVLRGGIPIENEWTHRPDQPWVMVSTVDQFGSRLLFRGYGVSQGMRPVHAGLAGNDCLVILDEVHLSVPFRETLAHVAKLESGGLPRRFAVVEMSATPNTEGAGPFKLDPTDMECEELRRRVKVRKEAKLVSVRNQDAIPGAVLKRVKAIGDDIRSVGVVVNRVRTARETHRMLEEAGYDSHLITGRMRPLDRVEAIERIGPIVDPDDEGRQDGMAVVVATQAIEVGADFSFDALVTECAAVDSLRQRFGRLDRRGTYFDRTGNAAQACIIGPRTDLASKRPDPIYGDSAKATWKELERRSKEDPIDVGPLDLQDFPEEATAARDQAPLLLKTYMDAWVQTNPEPIVQPAVDWFLHGMEHGRAPDVSIVWRWDRSEEAFRLVPPRQAEFLQVPIDAARSWLAGGDEVDVADVAQESEVDEGKPTDPGKDWVRWQGFDKKPKSIGTGEIRPGDILIVDPSSGGLNAGTWDPSSEEGAVEDLGDAAQVAYRRKVTLRLDPRLPLMDSAPRPGEEEGEDTSPRERIEEWLNQRLDDQDEKPEWFTQAVEALLDRGFEYEAVGTDDEGSVRGYYILTQRDFRTKKPVVDAATMDGSDEAGSMTGTGVTLSSHLDGVRERVKVIAKRLWLSDELAEDLCMAGRLHDLGKVDRRFQEALVGGDPVELTMREEEPLAKSLQGARGRWRYPRGMRHEAASVAMVESNPNVLDSAHDRDLVLHLIGTHHGWGRPLLPIIEDSEPQTLSYELDGCSMEVSSDLVEGTLALDMTDRFWRLVEEYGYYGLAWLEAILRLADHRQSEEEATQS